MTEPTTTPTENQWPPAGVNPPRIEPQPQPGLLPSYVWVVLAGLAVSVLILAFALTASRSATADAKDQRDATAAELRSTETELADADATVAETAETLTETEADLERARDEQADALEQLADQRAACQDLGDALDDWGQWMYDVLGWAADVIGNPFLDPGGVRGDALLARQEVVQNAVIAARADCIGDSPALVT